MTRKRATIAVGAIAILAVASLAHTPLAGARTVQIGRSLRGRAIDAQVLGARDASRRVLLVGCIHGDECAGRRILAALARERPPHGVELWLVGDLNPDGTATTTRQNADGVDLNRNFPFRWRPISDRTYYSGRKALSEPETRAAVRLIRSIRPAVTIWFHQHEDLVDMSGGDHGIARRYAEVAGLRATCLAFLPGAATSWSNHAFPHTTSFVVEDAAGSVGPRALARQLRAVNGAARGARAGSRSGCGPG